MDSNEHHDGATPYPERPADHSSMQPQGDGRQEQGNAVADLAGEFGAELVRAIRVGLAQGDNSSREPRGRPG
ncbi:hypothetical protein [Streptomyces sp. NPDC001833]|uniref:hypothetical protein n=1 Tax=Streptomyces sp. NPDC001833 TaxID=3154658 RepID=UPI003325BCFC